MNKEVIVDDNIFNQFADNLQSGFYKYHQFYNIVDPTIRAWYDIQQKFKFSKSPKKLPFAFFDIEVDADESTFPEPSKAKWPVNSIAVYVNHENKLYLFFIPPKTVSNGFQWWKENISKFFFQTMEEHKEYYVEGIQLEFNMYKSDASLINDFWKTVHRSQVVALIGYNSSLFDIPYLFNRGYNLFKDEYNFIVSRWGEVSEFGDQYEIPDMIFVDLLHLYKPQAAGGMALGKAQESYKLDYIAKQELDIGKLEHEESLYRLYRDNPIKYFVYNMYDALLLHLLNEKLHHVDTIDYLCKLANAPISKGMVGRSLLYNFNKVFQYWDKNQAIMSKLFNEEIIKAR